MIEFLEFDNWKSRESFTHEFDPGITFVLGPNGRGKSSVLEAITFGLFGRVRGSEPVSCIRYGADSARVTVGLSANGVESISRSVESSGSTSTTITASNLSGRSADADEILLSMYGADAAFLHNLVLLAEGDIYRYGNERDEPLAAHLARILPLGGVERLGQATRKALRGSTTPQRKRRDSLRLNKTELGRKQSKLDEAAVELKESEDALTDVRRVLEPLLSKLREEEIHEAQRTRHESWLASWSALTGDLLIGTRELTPPDVVAELRRFADSRVDELRTETARRGEMLGEVSCLERVVASLDADLESCPTCGQTLTPEHHVSVRSDNEQSRSELRSRIKSADRSIRELELAVEASRAASVRVDELMTQRPELPDAPTIDMEALNRDLAVARDEEVRVRAHHLSLQQIVSDLRAEIDQAERDRQMEGEVIEAFRTEALWTALAGGIDRFEAEVRDSIVRPLVDELGRQWKSFRPDAPWRLDIDDRGHLCMVFEGTVFPYSSLSGGEKAAALVLLRVALTRALTRVDFLLLDEPLEHLDPRSRRLLMSTLHQAVRDGMFQQVIVTTYEEQLVRRFLVHESAHALYLD